MKPVAIFALILLAVFASCTQKPAPVASENTASVDPADRYAIGVEYVAVPKASVYARPAVDAPVIDSYGLTEAVSILEKKGEWTLVRTFSGAGWVKATDLVDGKTAETMDTTTPRFFVQPKEIPFRARGELWLQAKVNTDGDVVEVKTIKNTTGSQALETANLEALKESKFYPMIEKGQHKTFIYEHRVYY
jgi:hypothetical protein